MVDEIWIRDYPQKQKEQSVDLDRTQEGKLEEMIKQDDRAIRSWTELMSKELPAVPETSLMDCLIRRLRRLQDELKTATGLFARRRIERQIDNILARLEKMGYNHPATGFIPIASLRNNR